MSAVRPAPNHDRRAGLLALAGELRPELHRYCARLTGSVIDGEDVVQDTLARAYYALSELDELPPLRRLMGRRSGRRPRSRRYVKHSSSRTVGRLLARAKAIASCSS